MTLLRLKFLMSFIQQVSDEIHQKLYSLIVSDEFQMKHLPRETIDSSPPLFFRNLFKDIVPIA